MSSTIAGCRVAGEDRLVLVTEILGLGAVTACGAVDGPPTAAAAGVFVTGAVEPPIAAGAFGLATAVTAEPWAGAAADDPEVAACG